MSIECSFGRVQPVGDVSIDSQGVPSGTVATCSNQIVEWIPPDRYAQHLEPGFTIRLSMTIGPDGIRRFLPESGDWKSFVVQCFLAGMAILNELGSLPRESATNVRIQFYASQWMKHRQDYLKRRFKYVRDIYVRKNSRIAMEQDNTMSDIAYLHPALESVGLVRSMANDECTSPRKAFFNGLYEIALAINPDKLGESERILKDSFLLHSIRLPELAPELLEEVNERLYRQMERQFDLASDEFNGWLTSPGTNLPTILKRMSGQTRVSRCDVNSGLFELGWLGLKETATCIHATMKTLLNSIPGLNDDERKIFQSLYFSQADLNNFPIILLLDRHDFLAPAMVDIWNGRDIEEVMPAIRNLLYFYGSMARHRRNADRIAKTKRPSPNNEGRRPIQVTVNEQVTAGLSDPQLQSILIDALKLRCTECRRDRLKIQFANLGSAVLVSGCCIDCGGDVPERAYEFSEISRALISPG